MQKSDIENLLIEYYKKRKVIENSFGYIYHATVDIRIKNLTKKYVDKINKLD